MTQNKKYNINYQLIKLKKNPPLLNNKALIQSLINNHKKPHHINNTYVFKGIMKYHFSKNT